MSRVLKSANDITSPSILADSPTLQLVRKWYRTEAALVDKSGYVKNHERGELIPPHNSVCAQTLASKEGFRRCNVSVRNGVNEMQQANAPSCQVHSCHLGLGVVMVKSKGGDDVTFCCGVATKTLDQNQRKLMSDKLISLGVPAQAMRGADQIVEIGEREKQRLWDLLELCTQDLKRQWEEPQSMVKPQEMATGAAEYSILPLKEQLHMLERDVIWRGLIKTHWNRFRLAKLLGISRTTLLAKIEHYQLSSGTKKAQN